MGAAATAPEQRLVEVWQDRDDPTVWLVFREGPSFPGSLAVDDWIKRGTCRATSSIDGAVERGGYLLMRATGPFDPDGTLGPDYEPA